MGSHSDANDYYMDNLGDELPSSIDAAAEAVSATALGTSSQDDGRTSLLASAGITGHLTVSNAHLLPALTDATDGLPPTASVPRSPLTTHLSAPPSHGRRPLQSTILRQDVARATPGADRLTSTPTSIQRTQGAQLLAHQYSPVTTSGGAPAQFHNSATRSGSDIYHPITPLSTSTTGRQFSDSIMQGAQPSSLQIQRTAQFVHQHVNTPGRRRYAPLRHFGGSGPGSGRATPESSGQLSARTEEREARAQQQREEYGDPIHEQFHPGHYSTEEPFFDRYLHSSSISVNAQLHEISSRISRLELSSQQRDQDDLNAFFGEHINVCDNLFQDVRENYDLLNHDFRDFSSSIGTTISDHVAAFLRDSVQNRVDELVSDIVSTIRSEVQSEVLSSLQSQLNSQFESSEIALLGHMTALEQQLQQLWRFTNRVQTELRTYTTANDTNLSDTEFSATPTAHPTDPLDDRLAHLQGDLCALRSDFQEFQTEQGHEVRILTRAVGNQQTSLEHTQQLLQQHAARTGIDMSNTVQETLMQTADRHEYMIKEAIALGNSAHVKIVNLANSGGQFTSTDGCNDDINGTPTQTDLPNSGGDLPASAPSAPPPATTESETVRQLRARISELEARNTTPVAGEQLQHSEHDEALAESIPQVDAEFASPSPGTHRPHTTAERPEHHSHTRRLKDSTDDHYALIDGYGRNSSFMHPNLAILPPEALVRPVDSTSATAVAHLCDPETLHQIKQRPNSMYRTTKPSDEPDKHCVLLRHGFEEVEPGETVAFAVKTKLGNAGPPSLNRIFTPIESEILLRQTDGRSPYHGDKSSRWYFNSPFNYVNIGDLCRAKARNGQPLIIGNSDLLANQLRTFTQYNTLFTAYSTNVYAYFWYQVERSVGLTSFKPLSVSKLSKLLDAIRKPLWSTPKPSQQRTQLQLREISQELISIWRSAGYLKLIERLLVGRVILRTTEDPKLVSFTPPDRMPLDKILRSYKAAYLDDHKSRVDSGQVLSNLGGLTDPVEPVLYPAPQGTAQRSHNPYESESAHDDDVFGTRRGHSLQALYMAVHHMYNNSPMDRIPEHTATASTALYQDIAQMSQSSLCSECLFHDLQQDARADDSFLLVTIADLELVQQNIREILTILTDDHGKEFLNGGDRALCTGFGLLLSIARSWRDSPFYVKNSSFVAAKKFVTGVNGPGLIRQGATVFDVINEIVKRYMAAIALDSGVHYIYTNADFFNSYVIPALAGSGSEEARRAWTSAWTEILLTGHNSDPYMSGPSLNSAIIPNGAPFERVARALYVKQMTNRVTPKANMPNSIRMIDTEPFDSIDREAQEDDDDAYYASMAEAIAVKTSINAFSTNLGEPSTAPLNKTCKYCKRPVHVCRTEACRNCGGCLHTEYGCTKPGGARWRGRINPQSSRPLSFCAQCKTSGHHFTTCPNHPMGSNLKERQAKFRNQPRHVARDLTTGAKQAAGSPFKLSHLDKLRRKQDQYSSELAKTRYPSSARHSDTKYQNSRRGRDSDRSDSERRGSSSYKRAPTPDPKAKDRQRRGRTEQRSNSRDNRRSASADSRVTRDRSNSRHSSAHNSSARSSPHPIRATETSLAGDSSDDTLFDDFEAATDVCLLSVNLCTVQIGPASKDVVFVSAADKDSSTDGFLKSPDGSSQVGSDEFVPQLHSPMYESQPTSAVDLRVQSCIRCTRIVYDKQHVRQCRACNRLRHKHAGSTSATASDAPFEVSVASRHHQFVMDPKTMSSNGQYVTNVCSYAYEANNPSGPLSRIHSLNLAMLNSTRDEAAIESIDFIAQGFGFCHCTQNCELCGKTVLPHEQTEFCATNRQHFLCEVVVHSVCHAHYLRSVRSNTPDSILLSDMERSSRFYCQRCTTEGLPLFWEIREMRRAASNLRSYGHFRPWPPLYNLGSDQFDLLSQNCIVCQDIITDVYGRGKPPPFVPRDQAELDKAPLLVTLSHSDFEHLLINAPYFGQALLRSTHRPAVSADNVSFVVHAACYPCWRCFKTHNTESVENLHARTSVLQCMAVHPVTGMRCGRAQCPIELTAQHATPTDYCVGPKTLSCGCSHEQHAEATASDGCVNFAAIEHVYCDAHKHCLARSTSDDWFFGYPCKYKAPARPQTIHNADRSSVALAREDIQQMIGFQICDTPSILSSIFQINAIVKLFNEFQINSDSFCQRSHVDRAARFILRLHNWLQGVYQRNQAWATVCQPTLGRSFPLTMEWEYEPHYDTSNSEEHWPVVQRALQVKAYLLSFRQRVQREAQLMVHQRPIAQRLFPIRSLTFSPPQWWSPSEPEARNTLFQAVLIWLLENIHHLSLAFQTYSRRHYPMLDPCGYYALTGPDEQVCRSSLRSAIGMLDSDYSYGISSQYQSQVQAMKSQRCGICLQAFCGVTRTDVHVFGRARTNSTLSTYLKAFPFVRLDRDDREDILEMMVPLHEFHQHWDNHFTTQHSLRYKPLRPATSCGSTPFGQPTRPSQSDDVSDVEEENRYPAIAQDDNYVPLSIHRRCLPCMSTGSRSCGLCHDFCKHHIDPPLLCMATDKNGMPCTFAMHYGCVDSRSRPMHIIRQGDKEFVFCPEHRHHHADAALQSHDKRAKSHDRDEDGTSGRGSRQRPRLSHSPAQASTGEVKSAQTEDGNEAGSDRPDSSLSCAATLSQYQYHYNFSRSDYPFRSSDYSFHYPRHHDNEDSDINVDCSPVTVECDSASTSSVGSTSHVTTLTKISAASFVPSAIASAPTPGSAHLISDDHRSSFPYVNLATNTVTLSASTVKAIKAAQELRTILNMKCSVDEQRDILSQCALFDSGAQSILLLTNVNSLGMQIIFPQLTLFTVKGFQSSDESSERLWGGSCYLPYLEYVSQDVQRYEMFGLICPSTPVCIVGTMPITRGLKLTLLENLDETIFKPIFDLLPPFAYTVNPETGLRSSRDSWLVGEQGNIWHRVICVYNKMLIAPATREARVLKLLENAPAHVPMTSPLYLQVAPIAAMPVTATPCFDGDSDKSAAQCSSSANASLEVHAGSTIGSDVSSLDDSVLSQRLKTTEGEAHPLTLYRVLSKLPKRDDRRRKETKPPNAAGLFHQVSDLFSLLTLLHTRHMELHGELSNSATPLGSALEYMTEYYFENYNTDALPTISENHAGGIVALEHLQPLAELALASATKTFETDYQLYSRVDHHLHSIPEQLMDYIGHLATCSGDIDNSPAKHRSDDHVTTTVNELRFHNGFLTSKPHDEYEVPRPIVKCRACGNPTAVCDGDPCKFACLNGCTDDHRNPQCDRHDPLRPTEVQLPPLTEPFFASHGDGMSPQIQVASVPTIIKPVIPGNLLATQRKFMSLAAEKLEGKVKVHGLDFREWIEEATIYERLKLSDFLEEARNAHDSTLRQRWKRKAHDYVRELAKMIEFRTSGPQAFR